MKEWQRDPALVPLEGSDLDLLFDRLRRMLDPNRAQSRGYRLEWSGAIRVLIHRLATYCKSAVSTC